MRTGANILIVLAALLVSATCLRADEAGIANGATAVQTGNGDAVAQVPKVPSLAPIGAEARYLQTSDGWRVAAWYWAPAGAKAPGVILLHMRGKDKSSWGDMPNKLMAEGYAVIAIDLRGHGETLDPQGRQVGLNALTEADYQAMLNDVAAAHTFLAGQDSVDGDRVALIGASIGANLAIMYAASDKRVRTVVALSPGLDYFGLKPLDYLEGYDRRALYLIASEGDKAAYEACLAIKDATAADPVSFRPFSGRDHGTNLLSANEGLDATIISGWLLNHVPPER